MLRHYEVDGPCLFEIYDRETLMKIDVRMAQFISALGGLLVADARLRNFSLSAPQELLGLLVCHQETKK